MGFIDLENLPLDLLEVLAVLQDKLVCGEENLIVRTEHPAWQYAR